MPNWYRREHGGAVWSGAVVVVVGHEMLGLPGVQWSLHSSSSLHAHSELLDHCVPAVVLMIAHSRVRVFPHSLSIRK